MKLCAFKLLQPTVFAITFLLIVMHLEQGWCTKRVVLLYHDISHNFLTTFSNRTIITMPAVEMEFLPYQCFEMDGFIVGNEYVIVIFNSAIEKYLCINRNGDLKLKPKLGRMCLFKETFAEDGNGHFQYKSICTGKNQMLALNKRGRPYRNRNATHKSKFIKQYSLFTKKDMLLCKQPDQKSSESQFRHQNKIMHCNKKKA